MGVLSGHRSVVFRFTQGSVLWQQKRQEQKCAEDSPFEIRVLLLSGQWKI